MKSSQKSDEPNENPRNELNPRLRPKRRRRSRKIGSQFLSFTSASGGKLGEWVVPIAPRNRKNSYSKKYRSQQQQRKSL